MFRRFVPRLCANFSLRAITDRLDSFEKEVIELKAFRQAVEKTSPEVALAAERLLKDDSISVSSQDKDKLDLPLTAGEFIEMTQFYALQKPNQIKVENVRFVKTMDDLLRQSTVFHREALVRLAMIAKTLSLAPYGLSQMPPIQELIRWYQLSFHEMINRPTPKSTDELQFFDTLSRSVFLRHYNVSRLLCEGLISLAEREGWDTSDYTLPELFPDLQTFFETFYSQRVKIRFLCGNYCHLSSQMLKLPKQSYADVDKQGLTELSFFGHDPSTFVGQLCEKTSFVKVAKSCIESLQKRYDEEKIELHIHGDENMTFIGVPYILCDIVSALLSDAVEENLYHQEISGKAPTKITVTLVQGPRNENIVMRVSDTAGGMRLDDARLSLTCWSTFRNSHHKSSILSSGDSWIHSPIRLSYANCAATCFGGNVTVASIEGYGTDRQLYIPVKGVCDIVV